MSLKDWEVSQAPSISQPVQHVPCRVPKTLKEKVMTAIRQMEKNRIIARLTVPTKWISSMVAIEKPGKFCICIDPSNLRHYCELTTKCPQ